MTDPKRRVYPETAAGGYSRVDSNIDFYTRVNALLQPDMVVLDFGAGRGAYLDNPPSYSRDLRMLRGKVAKVIGVDVDDAVHVNPSLDVAHTVAPGARLPLDDESVDLIFADWVFEHVDDPAKTAGELDRVLKPGGWICARTPNKRGYPAIGARLIPNKRHTAVLSRLQPNRKDMDVFPTRFRMNTRKDLQTAFPPDRFELFTYTHNREPVYLGTSVVAWRIGAAMSRVLPASIGETLMVFIHKRG